jgi:pimeloyl-ACP methyl ester carboxylesterase
MRYVVVKGEDGRLDALTRARLRGSFIDLSDGVTHYELSGPQGADVVVAVPGLTIPLFYWDRIVSRLHAHGLRTLCYSAYGRGYSDRVKVAYDDALFVRQLSELIAVLGVAGRLHFVGSSMGALVAMGYAVQHPAAATTLTLSGPAGLAPPPLVMRGVVASDRLAEFVARRFGRRWLTAHESDNLGDQTRAPELSAMLRDAFHGKSCIAPPAISPCRRC